MPGRSNAARKGVDDYVERVSRRLATQLQQRVEELRDQGSDADEQLGTPADLVERMMGVVPQLSPWRQLGPCYTTAGISRVLGGISRQAVEERRRRGTILALRTRDGVWVYPAFQLDARNRVLPGLSRILGCFDVDTTDHWALASFLSSPQRALDDRSIVEHLRAREALEPALALARDLAARWAA